MKLNFCDGSPSMMNIDHIPMMVSAKMVKRKKDNLNDFTPLETML